MLSPRRKRRKYRERCLGWESKLKTREMMWPTRRILCWTNTDTVHRGFEHLIQRLHCSGGFAGSFEPNKLGRGESHPAQS